MCGKRQWAIRAGRMKDIESVLGLWQAAETRPSPTDSELALARLFEHDPEALLLAEGDEVVGSLIVGWDGWRGSFYRLAVHPEWRRQGIASALVRAGEERLQALGAERLTAIVADDEYAAVALWGVAGYRRQVEMSRFVRIANDD